LSTGLPVGKGQKAEAVGELMGEHCDEIDTIAMIVVEAEIEVDSGETTGIAQVDIEIGGDIGGSAVLVRAGEGIGLRLGHAGTGIEDDQDFGGGHAGFLPIGRPRRWLNVAQEHGAVSRFGEPG